MTVSMRVMSAGDGYRYLLRSVAVGDGRRAMSTPLTRYYVEAGTPPGRWLGTGLAALGGGRLSDGDQVTEAQLALLIGTGHDPVTGDKLGRAYPESQSVAERVSDRVRKSDPTLDETERATEIARIEAEETARPTKRAVAGYDFTFSVPKSVSVLWGLADPATQEMIVAVHHAAVAEVLTYMEREVAATRAGVSNGNGAVAQVEVDGLIAAAFDHWDSRDNDPQLHTHLVISNKVKTLLDGRWRSLDGRPMHHAVTALSAYYNAVLADRLTGTFGLAWEQRDRGADRNRQWEIVGVGEELIREFSSRTKQIEVEKERLIDAYVAKHGRRPSNETIVQLRAQATLATRPPKEVRSLADLTDEWCSRAESVLGTDPTAWARAIVTGARPTSVDPNQIPDELIGSVAATVVAEVGRKRTTWRHWNLWAEASRQTMGWRFATIEDRESIVSRIVRAAEEGSVTLTPPELAPSPPEFQREDGSSVFRPRHAIVYSSNDHLAAEDRLLARADDTTATRVHEQVVATVAAASRSRRPLSREQHVAIKAITGSGRRIDVLVGPAGTGKTTTMRALRKTWAAAYGNESVTGLATSAAAAEVLADDLGIACENTTKWLVEHDRGTPSYDLRQNGLVIIDEATLADTQTLDRITAIAEDAGAKVLLVGDPAQIDAVDAGGAFNLLVSRGADVPTLTEIHRFNNDWEKHASLALRAGDSAVISTYARHGCLRDGTSEDMVDVAHAAWHDDVCDGKSALLIAEATEQVHALNERVRAARVRSGETIAGSEAVLADNHRASVGDWIITRHNDRRLRTLSGVWVRNGDRWQVTKIHRDGSMTVRRQHGQAATLTLPAEYIAEHIDLGYAVTAHRAQGLTVDTAHVLVSAKTTREHLYVAMTRGRDTNTAYVALDQPDESHVRPNGDDHTAASVLAGVLSHSGSELSAHQTATAEHETWSSIAQLAAEYETLAAAAQRDRWNALVRGSGLTSSEVEAVISSDAFGPLTAVLRHAESAGHDPEKLFGQAVRRRGLSDAEDPAAVLHHRIRLTVSRSPGLSEGLIAGLIPEATGPMRADFREALADRARRIEARARVLADEAARSGQTWVQQLGLPGQKPPQPSSFEDVVSIAAYRDRYQVTDNRPVGPRPTTAAQRADADRAWAAVRRLRADDRRAESVTAPTPHISAAPSPTLKG